jgi:non-canonical poly(A) RNA polymerase PAPD5/7
MEGMNEGAKSQYIEYITSDEESDAASTGGDDGPRNKRVKTEADVAAADSVPKWSNPDPYTVLPPTDFSVAPKKDIVQTIRKAKVEAASQKASTNAIKENADFISFNDFEEDSEEEQEEEQTELHEETTYAAPQEVPQDIPQVPQQAPRAQPTSKDDQEEGEIEEDGEINEPPGVDLGFAITPQFRNNPPPSTFPPPAPPADVSMALQDYPPAGPSTNASKGTKRKHREEPNASSAGYIDSHWQQDGSDPTPWLREDATFTAYVGLQ